MSRHFAESADDLALAFRALGIADRLQPLERGRTVPLSF
jgi:hypothetical protein